MAHRYRFFGDQVSDTQWCNRPIRIQSHFKRSRLSVGDVIEVCDGKGLLGYRCLFSKNFQKGNYKSLQSRTFLKSRRIVAVKLFWGFENTVDGRPYS